LKPSLKPSLQSMLHEWASGILMTHAFLEGEIFSTGSLITFVVNHKWRIITSSWAKVWFILRRRARQSTDITAEVGSSTVVEI
jgi:hypothetical protein